MTQGNTVDPASDRPLQRPSTLKDLAYRQVRRLIESGEFQADRTYSTIQLATSLAVSRTPVREALLQMTAEGYLVMVDGRGFQIRKYTAAEIRDFFEVRKLVELHCLAHGAQRMTKKDLARLKSYQAQMSADLDVADAFLEADKNFHLTLVRSNGNQHLEAIMENARNLIVVFGQRAIVQAGRAPRVLEEHAKVIDALERCDVPAAVTALREHLESTEIHLTGDTSR